MVGLNKKHSTEWKYKRLYNHDSIYMTCGKGKIGTEIRSLVAWGYEWEEGTEYKRWELLGVMKIFHGCNVVVVTQLGMCVKTHWSVHLKRMSFTVSKSYLNKANFKKMVIARRKTLSPNIYKFPLNHYTFMNLLLEYLIYGQFHSISMLQWSDVIFLH